MKQAERRARSRAAVLRAATAAFASDGYTRASLDRIAALAGVSKGAIHGYYPTKLELFLEVVDCVLDEARRRTQRVAGAVAAGELAEHAASRYMGHGDDSQHTALIGETWRMAALEPVVRERLAAFRRHRLEELALAAVDGGHAPARAQGQAAIVARLIDGEIVGQGLDRAASA
jgi:AcrR family transcriptional regulator